MQCSTPELTSRSGANYRTNRANMEGHLGEILRSRPTLLRRQRRSPDALAFDGLVEARQGRLVRGYFLVRGRQEDDLGQRDRLQAHVDHRDFLLDIHAQAVLPARHRQVDVGQQFRVEQRAVQLAMRIGHAVAVAQASSELRLPGCSSLACTSVSMTPPTWSLKLGSFRRANSWFKKPRSKGAL